MVAAGLLLLLADLWTPAEHKRKLGYAAATVVLLILAWSLRYSGDTVQYAFNNMYVLDGLALFFKRFFLLAAAIVLLIAV